jgi:hypothetical protein
LSIAVRDFRDDRFGRNDFLDRVETKFAPATKIIIGAELHQMAVVAP